MNKVFDTSHHDTLDMIRIDEDHKFLSAQRGEGRCGSMVSADVVPLKEEMASKRLFHECERIEKEMTRARDPLHKLFWNLGTRMWILYLTIWNYSQVRLIISPWHLLV